MFSLDILTPHIHLFAQRMPPSLPAPKSVLQDPYDVMRSQPLDPELRLRLLRHLWLWPHLSPLATLTSYHQVNSQFWRILWANIKVSPELCSSWRLCGGCFLVSQRLEVPIAWLLVPLAVLSPRLCSCPCISSLTPCPCDHRGRLGSTGASSVSETLT